MSGVISRVALVKMVGLELVCTTSDACQSGFNSVQSSTPGIASTLPSQFQNQTMVCNTQPRVFAASQMSCDVINPTLQAVFPLQSVLNIGRTLNSSLSPVPGATSFGQNGTIYAQLMYSGVEQFFCTATPCVQDVSDGSNWKCQNLECTCKPNTTFCGGNPKLDLTSIINGLDGELDINCGNSGGKCFFQQTVLDSLFGGNGLGLTGCKFGECVRQFAIDDALQVNSTSTQSSGGKELSGGVIAGLAVVGSLLFIAIALLVIGKILQIQARRNGPTSVQRGGIGVRWENIGYAVPSNYSSFGSGFLSLRRRAKVKDAEDDRTPDGFKMLLDPSTSKGTVKPGEMLAILGPSGAGKTTLIDIIAGKRKIGKVSGTVEFFDRNGNVVKKPRIGFVDQVDTLPPTLTPREYFMFVADLRLPESIPKAVKEERVSRVLVQLGLDHVADVRIGDGERRGISGGEMRRVSLGCELVAGCDVIVLDEPTSGLDSVSASKVANVLHSIATDPENPTAVIASIHQPNGPGGFTPVQILTAQGEAPCPDGYNIADWLLDVASEQQTNNRTRVVTSSREMEIHEQSGSELLNRRATGSGMLAPPAPGAAAIAEGGSQEKLVDPAKIERDNSVTSGNSKGRNQKWSEGLYATTYMTQFEVLARREWLNLKRDRSLFITHFIISGILGVFVGGLYFKTGITIAGFQARVGCLFFLGALIAFTTISALYNLVEVRRLFLRERASAYYSPVAWLFSRVIFDLIPLRLIPTLVLCTIVYWMAGLSHNAAHFFKFLLIIVLYAIGMTLWNFLLACTFRNGGIAILFSALTALYQQTYAGFFVHLTSIPPVLRWLQWICPLKYALEALSVNEVNSNLMIVDTLQGVPISISASLLLQVLFGFGANEYYRDVLVLFAFIAGFGILVILAVWYNVRERR
ncbi:hypothetical protein Clacol_006173 [Clathrus columnatus]|uniref:ABC transporter domain-containing protein n=1 Tax=Clathrus columnatus TaxID=1419009 RepID=A0AAV5AJ07_9AGAM|nr:hypothetical protein Clacol_006173 [Clathrus columnatus]